MVVTKLGRPFKKPNATDNSLNINKNENDPTAELDFMIKASWKVQVRVERLSHSREP